MQREKSQLRSMQIIMQLDDQLGPSPRMILLVPPRREERQRKDLDYRQAISPSKTAQHQRRMIQY